MSNPILTKKYHFCASHKYGNDHWSDEKNLEVFGKDFNNDGLVSGWSNYQLFGSSDIYTLKNSSGWKYSDNSSDLWDATAAKETGSGFEVLLEGSNGTSKEGYNYIWSTNSSGVITSASGWLTDAQTTSNGYESIFNVDFNKNGIID